MKKIALYDTTVGSFNKGDEIIKASVEKELQDIIKNKFTVKFSTHTPPDHLYQSLSRNFKYNGEKFNYGFIYGTNLFTNNMFTRKPTWNINIFNSIGIKNCVLVGVGSGSNNAKINWYTKKLYSKILSKEYTHSVRDEFTKNLLESMGFKVSNTGCATLWSLSKNHCNQIPTDKAEEVVFTLTDYKMDKQNDQILIDTLKRNYKKVYFWVQGSQDLEYFKKFDNINEIEIILPTLEELNNVLKKDVDFVGTRLHCGIQAMKHKKRSIIIIVDNRAREMKKDFNLNAIERKDINELDSLINSNIVTNIKIDEKKINEWKSQFK